ncbi:MAG: biotin carboxylase N-terminal domain-containing protein [Paracoccaceae bacterium]
MLSTLLIANRGEIAVRIMRTAQAMGIRCVAVYSDADAGAAHVAKADSAVHIGGAAPGDSYLRGDVLIQAAIDTGAQAIHPGYGFLSENPDFVQKVEEAGLIFVGPSADAIRAMGLKDAAKALMEKANVPVVPGYHGANQDPAFLAAQATQIGYPVLIKAVAGGGGKGMRLVDAPSEFGDALKGAQREAQGAFGNSDVLIEKFVSHPRHIEVQVFGDGTRAIHLFERDCSLQRRHQKVIEEAPAPGMTDKMRAAMGTAAVRAAEAIGYRGAGTVEFIVDGSDGLRADRFYFMEMNTRLQVEHPVTEAITGIDLVELQLRVAAGEALPLQQSDLSITGHAFEARLYAEDVPAGFLPATGTLTHLKFPDRARADSGVRQGDEISPWYDPMIAKIITHGPTRDIALTRLQSALERTQVAGVTTNLTFLSALARHSGFQKGDVDTGLIARDLDSLTQVSKPTSAAKIAAGMAITGLVHGADDLGFTLWQPMRHRVVLEQDDEPVALDLTIQSPDLCVWHMDEDRFDLHWVDGTWRLNGQALPPVVRVGDVLTVFTTTPATFRAKDPLERDAASVGNADVIQAPMPGLVKAVFAKAGQDVALGDRLAILEAMKMEHTLTAARDGTIEAVLVSEGAQVAAGDILIQLTESET